MPDELDALRLACRIQFDPEVPVDYLYSLYDALVSIHVPNDKARAVVDAMERDMGATIATKSDLNLLRQELKSDLNLLRQELTAQISALGTRVSGLASREEFLALRAEMRESDALIRKDMEIMATTLSSNLTMRLGSMLMLGFGLLFAALKLT